MGDVDSDASNDSDSEDNDISGSNDGDADSQDTDAPNDGEDDGVDAEEDNDEAFCASQIDQSDCQSQSDDDGFVRCGFNSLTNECFAVVESNGLNGRGNFDDGFVAAQQKAQQQSSSLYTAIGILGGTLGALLLVIAGGVYFLYNRNKYEVERGYQHSLEILPQEHEMIDVDIEVGDETARRLNSHSHGHRRTIDSEL